MSGYHGFFFFFVYHMFLPYLFLFTLIILSPCHQFYGDLHSASSSSLFLFCSYKLTSWFFKCASLSFFLLFFNKTEETFMKEAACVGFTNTICWPIIKPYSWGSAFIDAIYVSNNMATHNINSEYFQLNQPTRCSNFSSLLLVI